MSHHDVSETDSDDERMYLIDHSKSRYHVSDSETIGRNRRRSLHTTASLQKQHQRKKNRQLVSKKHHTPSYVRFLKKSRQRPRRAHAATDLVEDEDIPSKPSRVYGMCFAEAMEMTDIQSQMVKVFRDSNIVALPDEVIRVQLRKWGDKGTCFVFCNYGVAVFWDMEQLQEQDFLNFLREACDEDSLLDEEDEAFDDFEWYMANPSSSFTQFSIVDNNLVFPNMSDEQLLQNQLSVSYGIATSVKLETLELGIEKTIDSTRQIPQDMSEQGKMGLSKMEISKYIGTLYIQKSSVNLMYDILDSPDYVWDDQEAEMVYLKCRKFLKIDTRVTVLNARLDVVAELLEMLRTEKSEQHSTRLEWIVIILIVVEVILGLVDILYNFLTDSNISVF
eukprot:m.222471 g.222471  ORF g.222471 m.222471 type:complete len:391 (-) comp13849_c2_seq32:3126-4298(-)